MNKLVLVVDDEPGIGNFLRIKLRLHGYEVITTESGAEAIDIVRSQKPDIVLLDILMPDVTGMDVLERVRTFSQVPIIVFTGRPDIAKFALRFGANDHIAKPFDPDQLVSKIDSVLNCEQPEKKTAKPKRKILLVDDEQAILKVVGIKLKISGYDVVTAPGGQEALDQIKKESPDIMLLDVIMPGIDGFEVLQKLRIFSELPVITFSARPENAQKALSLGANDFLAKPFDVDDMVRRIEKLLEQKS